MFPHGEASVMRAVDAEATATETDTALGLQTTARGSSVFKFVVAGAASLAAATGILIGSVTFGERLAPSASGTNAASTVSAQTADYLVSQSIASWRDNKKSRMEEENEIDFANRPPAEEWADLLERIIQAGRRDPCSADVISVMGWQCGFGCRMNCFIDDLWLAVYNGWSIAMCSSDDFVGNVWLKHFVNPLGIGVCEAAVCNLWNSTFREDMPWLQGFFLSNRLQQVDHKYIDSLRKFLAVSVYVPNEQVAGALDQRVRAALSRGSTDSLAAWPPYLGVHVRHGDKVIETGLVPDSKYIEVIKQYLIPPLSVVYIATDDPNSTASLRGQIEESEGLAAVVEQQGRDHENDADRTYSDDASLLEVLVDIEALRRADVFIGTASSNIGRLVYLLRDPEKTSYSLDFDNNFLRSCA